MAIVDKATPANPPQPVRIVLTGARSIFIGPNPATDAWRTAVATIIVGLETDILPPSMEKNEGLMKPQPVCVIRPGSVCKLETDGYIALLFCDALSDDHAAIDLSGIEQRIEPLRTLLLAGPMNRSPARFVDEVFQGLGVPTNRQVRPEIACVVSAMGRKPDAFGSVETAAQLVGLSAARFQHVFTKTVGMPFRRYRQWRRMGHVVRALANGENLTTAAHASGFASSAHLSAAFKRMFGLRPSDLIASDAEYFLSD